VLVLACALSERLSHKGGPELRAADMIDTQSFMWVIGPAYSI